MKPAASDLLGFTTMTFKQPLQRGAVSLEALFARGRELGFGWVELRDFDLAYSESELLAARALARRLGLRVHYAWDGPALADHAAYNRALHRAALFGPGVCSRVVVAPELIRPAAGKAAYDEGELISIVALLHPRVAAAARLGITLVFENSLEPLFSTPTRLGFDCLLAALPEMRMTLDTGNPCNAATMVQPVPGDEVLAFARRWSGRIPYLHHKSTCAGVLQSELRADGDVPLPELLAGLSPETWHCVELPGDESTESGWRRLAAGLECLRAFLPR
jgi:sugar phosphate isomerase/epimerase